MLTHQLGKMPVWHVVAAVGVVAGSEVEIPEPIFLAGRANMVRAIKALRLAMASAGLRGRGSTEGWVTMRR